MLKVTMLTYFRYDACYGPHLSLACEHANMLACTTVSSQVILPVTDVLGAKLTKELKHLLGHQEFSIFLWPPQSENHWTEQPSQEKTGFTKVMKTGSVLKVDYTHLNMEPLVMASACNSRRKKPNYGKLTVKNRLPTPSTPEFQRSFQLIFLLSAAPWLAPSGWWGQFGPLGVRDCG